ncbi:MAG: hypothetical protein V7642_2990 [Burkholderiales bacterium]|jgi:hypothetical protein
MEVVTPKYTFDPGQYDDSFFRDLGIENPFNEVTDIYDSWTADFGAFIEDTEVPDMEDVPKTSEKFGKWSETYQEHISKGNGNAAVDDIIKGYKDGTITKEEAITLAKTVQEEANQNGGGKINNEKRNELKKALGVDTDYISKGKTRGQLAWEEFVDGFTSVI